MLVLVMAMVMGEEVEVNSRGDNKRREEIQEEIQGSRLGMLIMLTRCPE